MDDTDDEVRAAREEASGMARTGDRMEDRLEELGGEIQDAKRTAAERQDAPDGASAGETADDPVGQTAGDWEGQATDAPTGDDPEGAGDER